MRNRKFDRIKRSLAILLVLCFALSLSVVSASAAGNSNYVMTGDGHTDGYNKGYEDGKTQAQLECEQYGSTSTLSKIPSPYNDYSWSKQYTDDYNKGYVSGYIDGYNKTRYGCLK